nr:hypothetical protein [Tanacetum cinerariifolium]
MMCKGSKNHNSGFNSKSAHGNAAGMYPNKVAHDVVGDLVSSSLRVPCIPGTTNVVALLGVSLNTLRDIDNLTKAIDLGKLEAWSDLPSEMRMEVIETIWAMWDAFLTENPNVKSCYSSDSGKSDVGIGESLTSVEGVAAIFRVPLKRRLIMKLLLKTAYDGWNPPLELESAGFGAPMIIVPSMVSPCEPIVKTIDTDDNSDPIVQSVDINTIPTSYTGLEAVMKGGPWLIRKALIILKKWSTDTKLLKEELTRIPIWVKLHDGRNSFAWCLIEVNSEADLVETVTIGIPSLTGKDFTKETIRVEYEWRPPRCDELGKKKKKKGKSKTFNSGQAKGLYKYTKEAAATVGIPASILVTSLILERISQVTYQELVRCCLLQDFHLHSHNHLNPISISKRDGPWRIDDCVVVLVFEACGIPLRFGGSSDLEGLTGTGLQSHLGIDNTVIVNQIVTIFLIKSSIHVLDQNRYPVDTSLIRLESRKSPTAELFDVDSGRISIHHCTKEYHSECSGNYLKGNA